MVFKSFIYIKVFNYNINDIEVKSLNYLLEFLKKFEIFFFKLILCEDVDDFVWVVELLKLYDVLCWNDCILFDKLNDFNFFVEFL